MYIETSAPRVKGDKAWLLSQSFNSFSRHGRCMSFWYHMYGAGIGESTDLILKPQKVCKILGQKTVISKNLAISIYKRLKLFFAYQ